MVFSVKNFYPTILFFILITDLPASVWRTIIYEQNLKIRICLAKNAFHTLVKIRLDFIYWYNNAYHSLTSNPNRKMIILRSCFPPYHLVYDTNIALNDPDHFGTDIGIRIVRNRCPFRAVPVHLHREGDRLQQSLLRDP